MAYGDAAAVIAVTGSSARSKADVYERVRCVMKIISSYYTLLPTYVSCVVFSSEFSMERQRMQKNILNAQSHLIDSYKRYSFDPD